MIPNDPSHRSEPIPEPDSEQVNLESGEPKANPGTSSPAPQYDLSAVEALPSDPQPPATAPQAFEPFPPASPPSGHGTPQSAPATSPMEPGGPVSFPPGYAAPPPPVEPFPQIVPTGPARNIRLALSVIAPNVLALLLLWITSLIMRQGTSSRSGEYIMAEFVIIPLLMGLCAAFCLRGTGTGNWVNIMISVVNTCIAIALSYLVVHEGVICLVMVSPLLCSFIMVGGLIGRLIFRPRFRTLQLSLAPVLAVLLVADARSPHNYQTAVTDVVTINAPPERVWQYVTDVPLIPQKSDFWLCKIGLPAPVQATTSGHSVGAERRCIFERDLVFGEKIVELQPAKKLTFDIVSQPADPEIMGHLELQRGQMELRDNHDGTTTLIGTSWYRLKVYPAEYYDLWARSLTRDVHLRVMRHIKKLAETGAS